MSTKGISRLNLVVWGFVAYSFSTLLQASVAPACDANEGQWAEGPGYTIEQWTDGSEKILVLGSGARVSVIDSSDPEDLQILGFVDINESARYIDISPNGNVVAVSDRDNQIHLIDITNRSSPQLRGGYNPEVGRAPHGMDIVGNILYAAVTPAGVWTVNIANLDAPTLIGNYIELGTDSVFDLEVRGDYAYVADDQEGLRVVDISTPATPTIVGEYAGATSASSVRIEGSIAYVSRRDLGVDIIDLTNETAPSLIGNYDTSGAVFQAAPMSNNRLAVADDFNGTLVLDISNPASPTPAGSYSADYAFALTALDNQVFVLSPGYRPSVLRSVDFTTPGSPMVDDELRLPGISQDVRTAGSTIIVANDANGMVLLDASNPEQPAYANRVANDFGYSSVEWVNNVAVGGSFGQFDVVNITNPYSPVLIKAQTFAEAENVLDMDRFGNHLYVALGGGGLKIYDMTSPASPVLLGTFVPAVGGVAQVAVHGDLAFTSAGDNFVRAVNLANLALPVEVGSIDMGSIVHDMDYAGSSLFVATQAQEVRNLVFQVSVFSEFETIDMGDAVATGVKVSDDKLYVAAQELGGLVVYDISNTLSPQFIEIRDTPGEALKVDVSNGLLSLAEGQNGVRTLVCGDFQPPGNDIFEDGFETLP